MLHRPGFFFVAIRGEISETQQFFGCFGSDGDRWVVLQSNLSGIKAQYQMGEQNGSGTQIRITEGGGDAPPPSQGDSSPNNIGVWPSGKAPGLGRGSREFESLHPDQNLTNG